MAALWETQNSDRAVAVRRRFVDVAYAPPLPTPGRHEVYAVVASFSAVALVLGLAVTLVLALTVLALTLTLALAASD